MSWRGSRVEGLSIGAVAIGAGCPLAGVTRISLPDFAVALLERWRARVVSVLWSFSEPLLCANPVGLPQFVQMTIEWCEWSAFSRNLLRFTHAAWVRRPPRGSEFREHVLRPTEERVA